MTTNFKSIFIGVVCFVIGGITGGFISYNSANSHPTDSGQTVNTVSPGTKKPRSGQDWGEHGSSNRLSQKPGPLRTDDSMISVPISLLKSLSIAKSNYTIGQPILDADDPVEAALGLTSVEKKHIEIEWQRANEQVRESEVKSMQSNDLDDGSVVLSMPDLSRERRQIAKQFMNSVNQTLGAERGEAFNATKQVDSRFSADAGERSITVKIESVGEGQFSYHMSLQDAAGSRVWVGDSIPLEIRHLADAAGISSSIENVVKSAPEE